MTQAGLISKDIKDFVNLTYKISDKNHKTLETFAEISLKFAQEKIIPHEELASAISVYLTTIKMNIPANSQSKLYIQLYKLKDIIHKKDEIISFLNEVMKYLCFTKSFAEFIKSFLTDILAAYPVSEPIVSQCLIVLFGLKTSCPPFVSIMYVQKLEEVY